MEILLVRHGQIAGDPHMHYQPPVQGCLSPHGQAQADALAVALRDTPITKIYCSPLGRAVQTAQTVAQGRGLTPVVIQCLEEWRPSEILTPGVRLPEDAPQVYPPELAWKTPWGEGTYEFAARLVPPFIETLVQNGITPRHGGYHIDPSVEGQRLAFFAHGGSLALLLGHLLGWPLRPYSPFSFDETGVAVLRFVKRIDVSYPVLVIPTA